MIDIFIPTIRPIEKVHPTINSIEANTIHPYKIHIIREGNCYAEAINMQFYKTNEPFIFTGADDLIFHKGWDIEIFHYFGNPEIMVVGTNDMGHAGTIEGWHSTHSMIRRMYCENPGATGDGCEPVLYPYKHNYTDTELVAVAKFRNVYAHAFNAKVEHVHPSWGKGTIDTVYEHGGLNVNKASADEITFNQRSKLWTKH